VLDLVIGLTVIISVCLAFEWIMERAANFLGMDDEDDEE
jgi:hypothetical protein